MQYIIVDLEATCWSTGNNPERMEIIEIGAVRLASAQGPVLDEFATFVRPIASRTLSDFCKELTSIQQENVDSAPYFWEVFPQFMEWIGKAEFTLCSWGAYDLNQFRRDCLRNKIPFPETLERHINLKKEFSAQYEERPTGMMGALAKLGIPAVGRHHRGIDDARNIAKIAEKILSRSEETEA